VASVAVGDEATVAEPIEGIASGVRLIFGTLPPKADEEDDNDHDPPQQDRSGSEPLGSHDHA